jgi:hypothetical protein
MDIRILYCLGALLLATNLTLAAEIKKWVDQNGQIHFGDHAPLDSDSVEVNPEIITTTYSNKSLAKTMRPGELRMIKNHDKRGKRLIKAKKEEQKRAKRDQKRITKAKNRCDYYQQKSTRLKRKLRKGYTRSEERRIEESLEKYNLKIAEYCN